jgi:hypothetical protein
MIHLSCPGCGRGGRVPEAKVGTRLHCVKCDAVFHVLPNGTVVLGEPPSSKPRKGGAYHRIEEIQSDAPPEPSGAVELVDRMPLPLLLGLGVFLIVAIGWAVRAWIAQPPTS